MIKTNTSDNVRVTRISSTADMLKAGFDDESSVELPLEWFPRLFKATQTQRDNYQLLGRGYGVHWPDVDEDLSAEGLIKRRPTREYLRSVEKAKN